MMSLQRLKAERARSARSARERAPRLTWAKNESLPLRRAAKMQVDPSGPGLLLCFEGMLDQSLEIAKAEDQRG